MKNGGQRYFAGNVQMERAGKKKQPTHKDARRWPIVTGEIMGGASYPVEVKIFRKRPLRKGARMVVVRKDVRLLGYGGSSVMKKYLCGS
jgi:hypothetical protein